MYDNPIERRRLYVIEYLVVGEHYDNYVTSVGQYDAAVAAKKNAFAAMKGIGQEYIEAYARYKTGNISWEQIEMVGRDTVLLVPHNGKLLRCIFWSCDGNVFRFRKLAKNNTINRRTDLIYIDLGGPEFNKLRVSLLDSEVKR